VPIGGYRRSMAGRGEKVSIIRIVRSLTIGKIPTFQSPTRPWPESGFFC
jgi:hypothetical protein